MQAPDLHTGLAFRRREKRALKKTNVSIDVHVTKHQLTTPTKGLTREARTPAHSQTAGIHDLKEEASSLALNTSLAYPTIVDR